MNATTKLNRETTNQAKTECYDPLTFGGTGGRLLGGGSLLATGESGPVGALAFAAVALMLSEAFSMTERLSMALKLLSSATGITADDLEDGDSEEEETLGEVGEMRTRCREGVLELEPSESEWWSTWKVW